jgi:prolyl-tRNA editing enzyme YbaK/EbsC (Cys-tRNA(Pro) deacylase)
MNAITSAESLALSLANDIDALYVLDQQAKALALQVKAMKDALADKYGESPKDASGKSIPFKGEMYEVVIQLIPVKGTVDYKKLCAAYKITNEQLDAFRNADRADIRVTPQK